MASKLSGVVSAGLAVVVFTAYIWRQFGTSWVALGTFLFICLLLYSVPFSVWGRHDPHAILLVSLALLATTFRREGGNEVFAGPAISELFDFFWITLKSRAQLGILASKSTTHWTSPSRLMSEPEGGSETLRLFFALPERANKLSQHRPPKNFSFTPLARKPTSALCTCVIVTSC